MNADVVVVGAGSAGAAAARLFARRGRRVVLVDKRPRGETGARWLNAIPTWCFDAAGVARPRGDETPLGDDEHTFHLIGPGLRASVAMPRVPMLHVDMRALVTRLLDDALSAGAILEQGHVAAIEHDGDRVRSVTFERGSFRFTVRAPLIIDATGLGAAIRSRVPALASACAAVGPTERCAAAQFQHEVDDPARLGALLARYGGRPGDDLAFSGIAGGYSTLTLFTRPDLREVGVLTGSIPGLGVASGLELYERFVESAPWLGRKLFGGAGAIPLRRPYATLGADGVALIGDAACQVYASHGSGVGMGLLAARALADAADGENDPGHDRVLSRYASSYFRAHGGLLAASDAFRRFLQGAQPHEMDSLLASGLLEPSLARAALVQQPTRPDVRFAMKAPLRALRAREAAARFLPLAVRTVLLERLGSLTGALERFNDPLLGPAAAAVRAGDWSLPDVS